MCCHSSSGMLEPEIESSWVDFKTFKVKKFTEEIYMSITVNHLEGMHSQEILQ